MSLFKLKIYFFGLLHVLSMSIYANTLQFEQELNGIEKLLININRIDKSNEDQVINTKKQIHHKYADLLFAKKKYTSAIFFYKLYLNNHLDISYEMKFNILNNIFYSYAETKKYKEALHYLSEVINHFFQVKTKNYGHLLAILSKTNTLINKINNNDLKSIQNAIHAIASYPFPNEYKIKIITSLSRIFYSLGDTKLSKFYLDKININQTSKEDKSKILLIYGKIGIKTKNFQEALKRLNQIIKMNVGDYFTDSAIYHKSWILAEIGENENALQNLKLISHHNSLNGRDTALKLRLLYSLGQINSSRIEFAKSETKKKFENAFESETTYSPYLEILRGKKDGVIENLKNMESFFLNLLDLYYLTETDKSKHNMSNLIHIINKSKPYINQTDTISQLLDVFENIENLEKNVHERKNQIRNTYYKFSNYSQNNLRPDWKIKSRQIIYLIILINKNIKNNINYQIKNNYDQFSSSQKRAVSLLDKEAEYYLNLISNSKEIKNPAIVDNRIFILNNLIHANDLKALDLKSKLNAIQYYNTKLQISNTSRQNRLFSQINEYLSSNMETYKKYINFRVPNIFVSTDLERSIVWFKKIIMLRIQQKNIIEENIDYESNISLRPDVQKLQFIWQKAIGLAVQSILIGDAFITFRNKKVTSLVNYISSQDIKITESNYNLNKLKRLFNDNLKSNFLNILGYYKKEAEIHLTKIRTWIGDFNIVQARKLEEKQQLLEDRFQEESNQIELESKLMRERTL